MPAWKAHRWSPRKGDGEDDNLRRAALLRLVGIVAEDPEVAAEASTRFDQYLQNRSSTEPNLVDSLVAIAARDGEMNRFERIRRAVEKAKTPQERRRFQLALADFRTPAAIDATKALALTSEIPTQDVGFLLIRLLGNRVARETTWKFIQERWADLVRRLPPMMASRLIEATASLQTRDHRKEVSIFFRTHPVETGARALKLALERFDINEELRRRAGRELKSWLSDRT